MATLSDRFDPRHNAFDALRLVLAISVAVSHACAIGFGFQPTWGETRLGTVAVDGFFVLSGFLITRSYLQLDSPARFARHRFLRIMPGFWVCLAVTALVVAPVAALLRGLPAATPFSGEPSAWDYLLGNAGLIITRYDIGGVLADMPQADSINGSLWTLFFEAGCYTAIGILGSLGVLRSRRLLVAAALPVCGLLVALQEAGVPVLVNDRVLRLGFLFLLGAAAYLFADRIPARPELALLATALLAASLTIFTDYRVLGAAPLAYLLLWAGSCAPLRWRMPADVSYGMFIYHWPVLQLLALTGLTSAGAPAFVLVGLAATLPVAAASWYLVERPALAHKNPRRENPTRPAPARETDPGREVRVPVG